MARPIVHDIDPKLVENLAGLGCKIEEIATAVGCSRDTLERRYAAEIDKGRTNVRISLRRWQLELAKKGNATMQIWLGKQLLGQRDQEVTVTQSSEDSKLTIVLSSPEKV